MLRYGKNYFLGHLNVFFDYYTTIAYFFCYVNVLYPIPNILQQKKRNSRKGISLLSKITNLT